MECTHASGCCGHSSETLSCPREKWCWKSKVSTSASAWGEGESGCCVQQKSLNWRISHDDLIVMRLHSEEARKPQPRREHFPADVRKRVHAPPPPLWTDQRWSWSWLMLLSLETRIAYFMRWSDCDETPHSPCSQICGEILYLVILINVTVKQIQTCCITRSAFQ